MATTESNTENEIKFWLKSVFKNENLKVNISGNSENGDGYMGDIVFVSAEETVDDKSTKKYDLVLKCSKKSQALRETSRVKEIFLNEICMYQTVLPYFIQFQKERGITDLFDNFPKCYGSFIGENMEVIVLENLKSSGYELWPKRQPLSRKHIDMVVTQYGKFHATSLALQNQQPVQFQKFVDAIDNAVKDVAMIDGVKNTFFKSIDETYELLKNVLDNDILQRWKGLKDQLDTIFGVPPQKLPGLKVILHGDCWNNNFMYLHQKMEEKIPLKVAFLDWQMSKYASPVIDLSYFLFTCISKKDLEELDDILITYHKSFISQLKQLDVKDPHVLYPLRQLLNEWKSYCKFGIMLSSLIMKIISTEKNEVMDVADAAENGKNFTAAFNNKIKDTENYKRRIRPIVEYVVKHDLV